MKVKIIKSTSIHSWYNNRIGEEFLVTPDFSDYNYYTVANTSFGIIQKQDCKIVELYGIKIGDRAMSKVRKTKGTIVFISEKYGTKYDDKFFLFESDTLMNGHDGNFLNVGPKGKDGYCWYYKADELVKIEEKFWMVLKDGSEYTKKRHYTKGEALKEAARLGRTHKNTKFYVLECVTSFIEKPKLKYNLLKPFSGRILAAEGACEEELIKFVNLYGFDKIVKVDENFIKYAEKQDGWIEFLLNNRFLEKN